MSEVCFRTPQTTKDALLCLQEGPDFRAIAGGTDLLPRIRKGTLKPAGLVSLRRIPELQSVSLTDGIRLGATATIGDLLDNTELCQLAPVLAQGMSNLGCVQVRNLATIGGNLINASPCADTAPPLLVLDAGVELTSEAGARILSLQDLFVAPGQTRLGQTELLSAILLPKKTGAFSATFHKVRRVHMDVSIASVAVGLTLSKGHCVEAKIAAGSVGPRPLRLLNTESLLRDRELSPDLIEHAGLCAAQEISPITDVRSTVEYRRHIVSVLVKRSIRELISGAAR